MGTQRVTDQQAGFTAGWNPSSDPAVLRPDQARALTNFRLATFGAASKRGGTQAFNTGSNPNGTHPIVAMLWWKKGSKVLVACDDGHLYYNQGAGGTAWTVVTGVAQWAGVNASNLVVFTDGTNEVVYGCGAVKTNTTGTAATAVTWANPTGASGYDGLIVYNDRLWGWSTASPFLGYSNLSTAVGSTGGDSLGVGASGGGVIRINTSITSNIFTCLVIGASLVIFQENGISRLTGFGQSDITVQPQSLSPDVNVVGPYAATVYNNVGWCVTRKGLYQVTEGSVQPVSTPDKPDPLVTLFSSGFAAALETRVGFNPQTNELYIVLPNAGTYIYQTVLGSWSGPWNGTYALTTGFTGGAFMNFPGVGVVDPYVLFSDNTGGCWVVDAVLGAPTVRKDGMANDGTGGAAWTSTLQCHRMYGQSGPLGAPTRAYSKSWRWANISATLTSGGTAPTCTQASMLGSSSTTTFSTPISAQSVYYQPGGGAYGPYVDVTITDTSTTPSQYEGVQVEGFLLGQR